MLAVAIPIPVTVGMGPPACLLAMGAPVDSGTPPKGCRKAAPFTGWARPSPPSQTNYLVLVGVLAAHLSMRFGPHCTLPRQAPLEGIGLQRPAPSGAERGHQSSPIRVGLPRRLLVMTPVRTKVRLGSPAERVLPRLTHPVSKRGWGLGPRMLPPYYNTPESWSRRYHRLKNLVGDQGLEPCRAQ